MAFAKRGESLNFSNVRFCTKYTAKVSFLLVVFDGGGEGGAETSARTYASECNALPAGGYDSDGDEEEKGVVDKTCLRSARATCVNLHMYIPDELRDPEVLLLEASGCFGEHCGRQVSSNHARVPVYKTVSEGQSKRGGGRERPREIQRN